MSITSGSVSRRAFVGMAGAAAASTVVAAAPALADESSTWDYEADVIVCGCGTGGAAAAIEAANAGADVIVIEKQDWLGGQLRRCGGGVAAAGSQVQKALGVDDNADDFYNYWIATANGLCDPDLVRIVCDESAGLIDWLIDDLGGQPVDQWGFCGGDQGLEKTMEDGLNVGTKNFEAVGMEPVARCHWFTPYYDDELFADEGTENSKFLEPTHPGGTALWKIVGDELARTDAEVMTETALTRFVIDATTGEIAGVVAQQGDKEVRMRARRGVVLATGNFASNHEMYFNYTLADFEPTAMGGNGLDLAYENDGSGINAALAVGAQLYKPSLAFIPDKSYMMNGLKIDTDARVIDVFGQPIPRLYASSLAAGGFMGELYPLCGGSVSRNLIFGRIAGRNVAAESPAEG